MSEEREGKIAVWLEPDDVRWWYRESLYEAPETPGGRIDDACREALKEAGLACDE